MKNKELAIEIIGKDCAIKYAYCDADGLTCAVGALALAAGAKEWELRDAKTASIWCDDPLVARLRFLIESKFGLVEVDLAHIQDWNDASDTPEKRRIAIIGFLNTLPDE